MFNVCMYTFAVYSVLKIFYFALTGAAKSQIGMDVEVLEIDSSFIYTYSCNLPAG